MAYAVRESLDTGAETLWQCTSLAVQARVLECSIERSPDLSFDRIMKEPRTASPNFTAQLPARSRWVV